VTDADLIRVLVVCTANRCRSPLAAALLADALARYGHPAEVGTAGLRTPDLPATDETLLVADRRDLDLSAHRSRRLTADDIGRADLVIGMELKHVREVVALVPAAWPRTFTLLELARRGAAVGPRDGESVAAWLDRVHEGRDPGDLLGKSAVDDIDDPSGAPIGDHEDVARELERLVEQVAELLVGTADPDPIRWMAE
jgi:protein-tyrosine phosphatase